MRKEKRYLIFACFIQAFQIFLLLFFHEPVGETVFLPELLSLWVTDASSLSRVQGYALGIGLASWLASLACLSGVGWMYREKRLPVPVFVGIAVCAGLLFAGMQRGIRAAGRFRFFMLFLEADGMAWVLIAMIFAGWLLRRKEPGKGGEV